MVPTAFSALELYCSYNCFCNTLNDMCLMGEELIVTSHFVLSSWWWIFGLCFL